MIDWIIGTGVAVSLLIVLVLIIRRPFAKMFGARAAYALWLLPFIRLVMPEVTIPRIFPRFANNTPPETVLPTDIVLTPEMVAALQVEPNLMSQIEPYILPVILGLWVFGAVVFFLYHWTRQASYMDRLTYASEPATQIRQAITSAAKASGLKRIPQVRISDEQAGPLVAGFLRPIVILPDNFMMAFTPQQRHYALMHEFMHIKRGDVWVALAWLGFRAVNWPNPLVHYAAKHFRSDQEAACDASVLSAMGDTKEATAGYAETLIHAAKTAISDGRASPQPSQLALTIHHPLKERLMILGTHRKTSNWRSRIAAAVMIIGAATLSAPMIQADAHPEKQLAEEELAGKYDSHQGKSVIKRKVRVDGKTISEHFEINVDGDDVEAYKIGPFGKKTRIDVEDIDGVDVDDILVENIEGDISRTITISDGDGVKVMSLDDFKKWAETEYPEWKENDFASWKDGDFKAWAEKMREGNIVQRSENGTIQFEFKNMPNIPKPPAFPQLSKRSVTIHMKEDAFKNGQKVHMFNDKGEKVELNSEEDALQYFWDKNGNLPLQVRLKTAESMLQSTKELLDETEMLADDSREMVKAKRELEKARKALKAAEKALKEAE